MATFAQVGRPLTIRTDLGSDALLVEKVTGTEAISELFRFQLDLLAPKPVEFRRLLNQSATLSLTFPEGGKRHVSGIISRLSQGNPVPDPDGRMTLIRYRAELVPALWRLTLRTQSRVLRDLASGDQRLSVPKILSIVLSDEWRLDVDASRLKQRYEPRNYCVQYGESDFAFLSRLMEEEGIAYWFVHTETKHTLVLSDMPQNLPSLEQPNVPFHVGSGVERGGGMIWGWEKTQEVRANLYTLWDYTFESPQSNLEAHQPLAPDSGEGADLAVGTARHRLNCPVRPGGGELLEHYDYPGRYAHHFDKYNKNGAEQAQEIPKLFQEKDRVVRLRAEAEAAQALSVRGAGDRGDFCPGFTFRLERHFDADDRYLLTRVEHSASQAGTFISGQEAKVTYENTFTCMPAALPFRPPRVTPWPRIEGAQTAVVVGPEQSILVDPYGRVKVKFPWDRGMPGPAGQSRQPADLDRSCWVRVGQVWAGNGWGAFFWPRPGHEVIVAFEDGDPERPIITGSVYNEKNRPPVELSEAGAERAAGFKSCSVGGDSRQHFNALVFHDEPGAEHLQLHSEKHALHTGESLKFSRNPGPDIEFSGSLFVPGGSGSGGGGGPLHAPLLCRVGSALLSYHLSEISAIPSMFLLPSKTSFVCGPQLGVTLFGRRNTHIMGGQDVKYLFDPKSILVNMMPPNVKILLGILNIGPGVSGDVSFTCGPKVGQTYFGAKVDVNRCESFTYKAKSMFAKPTSAKDLVARLLTTFIAGLTLASDIIAYNKGVPDDKSPGQKIADPFVIALASGKLIDLTHGILTLLEKALARAQMAKERAHEVMEGSKLAAKDLALLPILRQIGSLRAGIAQMVDEIIMGLDNVAYAAGELAGVPIDSTKDYTQDSYSGHYLLNAADIVLVSRTETGNSNIIIHANGSGQDGYTTISGSMGVSVRSRSSSLHMNEDQIWLSQGGVTNPRVWLTKSDMTLATGITPLQPRIVLDDASITLSVGASKITIGPTGVKIEGLNSETTAYLTEKVVSTINRGQARAIRQLAEGVAMVGS